MIRVLAVRLARGVRHEPAQPIGGRVRQAAAQRVDPDHRLVDSLLSKAAQVRAQLRLVPSLKDHFPPSHVRRSASSEPPPLGLLPPLPLPLPWHRPRIADRRWSSKAIEPSARALQLHATRRPPRPPPRRRTPQPLGYPLREQRTRRADAHRRRTEHQRRRTPQPRIRPGLPPPSLRRRHSESASRSPTLLVASLTGRWGWYAGPDGPGKTVLGGPGSLPHNRCRAPR